MARTTILWSTLLALAGCGGLSAVNSPVGTKLGSLDGDDDDDDPTDVADADADSDSDSDSDSDADSDTDTDTDADADSDADADADADTDTDTDTDTGTVPCSPIPDEPLADQAPSGSPPIDPRYVVMSAYTAVDGDDAVDYLGYDPDGGTWERYSAALVYDLFDDGQNYLCSIVYDFSEVTTPRSNGWASGMYQAWDVNLSGGWTDCPPLDTGYWSLSDPRDLLAVRDWGVGFDTLDAQMSSDLQAQMTPADWSSYWAAYVFTMYATDDRSTVYPQAYSLQYERECGEVLTDASGYLLPMSSPSGPASVEDYVSAQPFYFLGSDMWTW